MAKKTTRSKKKTETVAAPVAVEVSPPVEEVVVEKTPTLKKGGGRKKSTEAPAPEVVAPPEADPATLWQAERDEFTRQVEELRLRCKQLEELQEETQQAQFKAMQEAGQLAESVSRLQAERDNLAERLEQSEAATAHFELELELTQQQSSKLRSEVGSLRQELESEVGQMGSLHDEMAEVMRRLESREASILEMQTQLAQTQECLQVEQDRSAELTGQLEELDLLREDLEETIVDRRREVKALRVSEAKAREYAEECKVIRVEAEGQAEKARLEQERLRKQHEEELAQIEARLEVAQQRQQELLEQLAEAQQAAGEVANQAAVEDAERRHLAAEKRLVEVYAELEASRKGSADRERLERRCILLENDLKAANQELLSMERLQSRWETEKQQMQEELSRAKAAPAVATMDEGEVRVLKIRCEELRDSLRKQRSENERLVERVDILMKAKELEEKRREEVESRLRTALRIQSRQQQGY